MPKSVAITVIGRKVGLSSQRSTLDFYFPEGASPRGSTFESRPRAGTVISAYDGYGFLFLKLCFWIFFRYKWVICYVFCGRDEVFLLSESVDDVITAV